MRFAIFISSGIGNALLQVPLIKSLSAKGKLTAISTSPFNAHRIFDGFEDPLFDEVIHLDSAVGRIMRTAKFKRKFDVAYLDHFAADRKNLVLAHTNSKKVITSTVPQRLPQIFQRRLELISPDTAHHEATRYMRFDNPAFTNDDLSDQLFKLTPKNQASISEAPYITLQPGSGNSVTPWKTLSLEKWFGVLDHIIEHHPHLKVVVLGDDTETDISEQLPRSPQVINAIGTTALDELPAIVSKAKLHLGNDSSLLHLAGCLGVRTISVWGGSDPDFYGWHVINPDKHHIIYKQLECGPCSRWLKPNTSRVDLPSLCPDYKCLKAIHASEINTKLDQLLDT